MLVSAAEKKALFDACSIGSSSAAKQNEQRFFRTSFSRLLQFQGTSARYRFRTHNGTDQRLRSVPRFEIA
jgi:hypothetical protein